MSLLISTFLITFWLSIVIVNAFPRPEVDLLQRTSDQTSEEQKVRSAVGASRYRLPKNVTPIHYYLRIRPILEKGDPNQFRAPGEVVIRVTCSNTTKVITLHAALIDIDESSVKVRDETSREYIEIASPGKSNPNDETYTISLKRALEAEKVYHIHISFTAELLENGRGFYRSRYIDDGGNTRWIASTQFQQMDARKAFPCFDEPAMKATFDITIGYNQGAGYHALCNMDVDEDAEEPLLPGWRWSKFHTTVKMSSYLVAMVVSDFVAETAYQRSFGTKPIKTWGQRNLMEKDRSGASSTEITAKNLVFYEQYFNHVYDLPKMDSVAIPGLLLGAMENWGLITYKIERLLYFKGETTELNRRRMTSNIAHEVAHQWFGNLVTMEYWDNLWLNEGLATYAAILGSAHNNPEFDSLNTEAIDSMQIAMEVDAGPDTFPVSAEEGWPPTQIIYDKSSSLVRMMKAFLTEETLKKGITYKKNDLFRILNGAAQLDGNLPGLTVKEIMDTWTLQTGYPLIRVTKASAHRVYISQERFKYQKLVTTIKPNEYWWVPVTYTTAKKPNLKTQKPKFWIPKYVTRKRFVMHVNLNRHWIFVNPNGNSFYRVLYDIPLSKLIKGQLDRDALSAFSSTSRSQILDDYFTMAYNGYIPIERALEFTTYLGQENSLAGWRPVLRHLELSFRLLSSTEINFAILKTFFLNKIESALELIGPEQNEGSKGVSVILRVLLLNWACRMSSTICSVYVAKLYSRWIEIPEINPIPVDLKEVIQCAGTYLGGAREINFVKEQFRNSIPDSASRKIWLNATTCISNATELQLLLSNAFQNEEMFSKDEATTFLVAIALHPEGRVVAFAFLEQNLQTIFSYLRGDVTVVEDLFAVFARYYSSQDHISRMETFVETNGEQYELPISILRQHITSVLMNAQWMTDFGNDMVKWFKSQSPVN